MATISETLEIIFLADDKLSATVNGIDDKVGTLDSSFGGLGGKAVGLSKDLALVGAAMGGLAVVFAGFAVKEAAAFQTQIQGISTLLSGTTENDLPAIRAGILDLAKGTSASLEELTGAFYDVQSGTGAGVAGLSTLEAAMKAGVAGATDAKTAAGALITVLNSYGLEATEAGRVSDVMFTLVRDGIITFEQLATGVGKVAKTGQSANQTFETTAAAMAIITGNTNQQAESFTKLEGLYVALSKTPIQESFRELGIEVLNASGALKPLGDIISGVSEKQLTFTQILKLLPEKEAAAAIDILAGSHDKFQKELLETNNSLGATDKAYAKMAATFDFQVGVLKNAWATFLLVAGDPILEALSPVIEDLSNALSDADASLLAETLGASIANWITQIKSFLGSLNEIFGVLTDVDLSVTAVKFSEWVGDTETIKTVLNVISKVIGGVAIVVAAIHDGFILSGEAIATGIVETLLLSGQALSEILKLLDAIPGVDLTAPVEGLTVGLERVEESWAQTKKELFKKGEAKLWSDDVAQAIISVDNTIKNLGTTAAVLPSIYEALDMDKLTDVITGGEASLEDFQASIQSVYDAIQAGKVDVEEGEVVLQALIEGADGASLATDKLSDATKKGTAVTKDSAKAITATAKELDKAGEIASKERVAVFEIKAKVDIASIEAATDRFKSSLASIDVGIQSTGETISSLFGSLSDADDPFDKWNIEAAIAKEEKFREQEFDLQKKQIELEMELTRAKMDYMEKGEAKIEVNAAGLAPALEAILWEILELIQVRANAQGAEFLLGLEGV